MSKSITMWLLLLSLVSLIYPISSFKHLPYSLCHRNLPESNIIQTKSSIYSCRIPFLLYSTDVTDTNIPSDSNVVSSNTNPISQLSSSHYVTTNAAVKKAVNFLSNCSEIALDFEFDRNSYAYGFTMCLIQIWGQNTTFIIDPIGTKLDLSPLYRNIFENDKMLKVIHAPSEDIKLLQTLNCRLVNIFDTERCSKLLNYPFSSLLYLLNNTINIQVDKSEQRSNWLSRPLSTSQIEYAKKDVLYLIELKNELLKLGEIKGILDWIQQENEDWTNNITHVHLSDTAASIASETLIPKKDLKIFSPYQLHIYKALLILRDQHAKAIGKPPFFIISKDTMYSIIFNLQELDPKKKLHGGNNKLNIHLLKGVHFRVKNPKVSDEFEVAYQRAITEANLLGLSKEVVKYVDITSSPEFALIQTLRTKIGEKYGINTAAFVLPAAIMQKLHVMKDYEELMGDTSIALYRRQLISKVIQEFNIPLFIK